MITFRIHDKYPKDNWSTEGQRFTEPERLRELNTLIEKNRLLVAEHWHYRGSRCQDRLVVSDLDEFIEYLKREAVAGDIIDVFDLTSAWSNRGEPAITGKCPDAEGEIPATGAY